MRRGGSAGVGGGVTFGYLALSSGLSFSPCLGLFLLPLFCEPVLATGATKKEYSGELGSQNDSKMEPKMEPRQQRPILTKHAQA